MNFTGAILGGGAALMLVSSFNGLAPVTFGMVMHEQSRTDTSVIGRVTGYKIKDCAVVANSFVGWQKVDGIWSETPFQFIDDPSPNSTRPDTWASQDFGFWEWPQVSPDTTAVKMTLQHNCHGDFTVTQATFLLEDDTQ